MIDYREIAKTVLRTAMELDHRFKPESITADKIDIWAEVFEGKVWPDEARQAVIAHYRDGASFQLMPGDVVEHCANQYPWSSREHAMDWLFNEVLAQHPFTPGLERYCGLTPPELRDMPRDLPDWDAHKAWAQDRIGPWLRDNLDEIVNGMLRIRFTGRGFEE